MTFKISDFIFEMGEDWEVCDDSWNHKTRGEEVHIQACPHGSYFVPCIWNEEEGSLWQGKMCKTLKEAIEALNRKVSA